MTTDGTAPEAATPTTPGWVLGVLVPTEAAQVVGRPAGFTTVRAMTDDEHERLHAGYQRLAEFNLSRLLTPWHMSGADFIAAVDDVVPSGTFLRGDVEARLRIRTTLDACLAAFTASTAHVEAAVKSLEPEQYAFLKTEFARIRDQRPDFLLWWQLRNLSQHQRSAAEFLEIRLDGGMERMRLDVDGVLDFVAGLTLKDWQRKPWDHLRHEMGGEGLFLDPVDLLFAVRDLYDEFVARALARASGQLNRDITLVWRMYVLATEAGTGGVIARRDTDDERAEWQIDPRTCEGAMMTVDWVCEQAGAPPVYRLPENGLFAEPPMMIWAARRREE